MSIRRAIVLSYVDKYATLAISIASTMVLARLLTPEQIGIYAIGAVFAGLAGTLRDLGAGAYIIREPELTEAKLRSALALALGLGAFFAVLLAILSVPIGGFYEEQGVEKVLLILSVSFLIVPLGSTSQGVLTRDMHFGSLAVINLCSMAVHAAVAVLLAWHGWGYESLAWAAVAAALTSAIVTNFFRPRQVPWLPGLREIRSAVRFGAPASGSSLISDFSAGVPELVIGRLQGFEAAGLYGRAHSLVTFFQTSVMGALWRVTLPYFSEQNRVAGDVKPGFLQATTLMTGAGWPLLLFMAVMAFPLMRVLFGSQWDAAVDPARVLCLGAIAGSLMAFASQALLATGDARRLLWFQVFALAARVVLALLGAMQGLLGLAIALALGSILSTTALVWMLRRAIGLSVADLNTVIGKSGALALIAVSPALLLVLLVGAEPDQPFLTLAASVPLVAAAFLAGALWLRHPIGEELARAWLKFRAAA